MKEIKIASNEENKTESVFMMNNVKLETESSVSAFSYWELSYATNVATRLPPHPPSVLPRLTARSAGHAICF